MRLHYAFTNLCGTVYRQGPILFEPNTHALLAAVGNRVSTYNLKTNATTTLPVEARTNVVSLAIAPDGASLITVDADGRLLFINLRTRAVVAHLNLKRKCAAVAFSPDGRHVAFALGRLVQVWRTPQLERSFTPFELHHTLGGHGDDVLCLAWSSDSLFLASGGLDMNVVVHSLHSLESYKPPALTGHRSSVKSAFFAEDDRAIYAVAKDSSVSVWRLAARPDADPDEVDRARAASVAAYGAGRGESWLGHWWELAARHFFEKSHARVVSAAYHAAARILVVGFNSGVFALYEMPGCTEVHTLSISDGRVDTCAISPGGEWLAFGCAQLGQLLVWEWQAESYVLKQQGHFFAEVTALAYSPGGTIIATGGGDAKVKLWSPASGFCFVTFSEHTAAVSDVAFVPHGRAVLSASLDGTVRAYDLLRYRNFQTLVTPTAAQLECVAVDPSGEIVCAGTLQPSLCLSPFLCVFPFPPARRILPPSVPVDDDHWPNRAPTESQWLDAFKPSKAQSPETAARGGARKRVRRTTKDRFWRTCPLSETQTLTPPPRLLFRFARYPRCLRLEPADGHAA